MYQLWGKKRDEANFQFITEFDDVNQKYSLVDSLDESIYSEAIVISAEGCQLYVEFEKPFTMKMRRNKDGK